MTTRIHSAAVIFILALFFVACNQKERQQEAAKLVSVTIDIEEAKHKLEESKCIFVDLRTPEEIAEYGKIESAIEINFRDPEFNSKLAALDKSKPYVVYCMAGGRSGKTREKMKEMGFEEVYDMTDGYSEWKERNE